MRTQVKVNEGCGAAGQALGFFKAVTEVMIEPDIALIDAIPQAGGARRTSRT